MDGLRVTLSFIHFLITRPVGVHRRLYQEEGESGSINTTDDASDKHVMTQKYFLLTNVRTFAMTPCTKSSP
jgi:hypothetical protein